MRSNNRHFNLSFILENFLLRLITKIIKIFSLIYFEQIKAELEYDKNQLPGHRRTSATSESSDSEENQRPPEPDYF